MRHEKAEQMLRLARALAGSAEGMTLDDMATELGVGRRTVERIRDALFQLFPAMEEFPDGQTKRFRIPGGLDGFYKSPTTEELNALGQTIATFDETGLTDHANALRSLEAKVRAALKPPVLRRIAPDLEALLQAELIAAQAGPRPIADDSQLVSLREAICGGCAVQFYYRGPGKPARTREVAPYGIIFGRMNYLIGPELNETKIKNWRLDRISNITILSKTVERPSDFSLPAFAKTSFGFFQADPEDVVLRVLPSGMEDFDTWSFHPDQTVERQVDGGAIVRFRASGMLELAWHLFTWQNRIQILEPASLRALMQHELATASTHHQQEPTPPSTPASVH